MKNKRAILKAVIVDDEKDLCFLLQNILEQSQIKAVSVNNLKDASEALKKVNPGIIFLDNQLPDGSGVEQISKMKEKFPASRIVMMTAYNTDTVKEEAIKNGADCFLIKPFSRSVIEKTLTDLRLRPSA